jgi:hypothetical protein
MIKIQEHLDRGDAENYLETLSENLWNELNPKVKGGKKYKVVSLVEKCKKYSAETITNDYRIEYANNDDATALRHKRFFDFLTASGETELKKLIISKPSQFPTLKAAVLNILNEADLFTGTPGNYSQTNFGKILSEKVFDYTKFRGSDFCKELFDKLGFTKASCPYCNDNNLTITKLKTNSSSSTKLKAYLDLDHFYPKSQHPYFAVSFFNLIPTCHDCNANDKRDKQFAIQTHIHPYHEAFDDFYKFHISLKNLLGDALDEIEIEMIPASKPADTTLNDLNLVARYANHIPQAENLVDYYQKYKHYLNTPDRNVFIDALFKLNGGIPKERKTILKSQRGKMSRDILKQLDITNILGII